MIQRILAGTTTDTDIADARTYDFEERKKLLERMLSTLDEKFEEALLFEGAMEDVGNALKQARPVFAAGLPVDQSFGFITKMIQESLDELEEAGGADTEEYEKQELVLEKINEFIAACNETGNTQGDDAYETAHYEFRGELGKLEALKTEAEAGIAHSIAFLQSAYDGGNEVEAFVKGLDRHHFAARFIGTFGSPSFFAFKRVGAPGEVAKSKDVSSDSEAD